MSSSVVESTPTPEQQLQQPEQPEHQHESDQTDSKLVETELEVVKETIEVTVDAAAVAVASSDNGTGDSAGADNAELVDLPNDNQNENTIKLIEPDMKVESEVESDLVIRQNDETKSVSSPMIQSTYSLNNIESMDSNNDSSTQLAYDQELARLRELISIKNSENLSLETKLIECEQNAKSQIDLLNQNFTLKLEQTLKKFQEGHKDKTSSLVMKYAEAEKRCIDLNRNIEYLQNKIGDSNKEKQRLNERFEKMKAETDKLNSDYEKKIQEIMTIKRDNDKIKESLVVSEAREKASQLKLKQEMEAHLTTKRQLEQVNQELNELRKANLKEPSPKPSDESSVSSPVITDTTNDELRIDTNSPKSNDSVDMKKSDDVETNENQKKIETSESLLASSSSTSITSTDQQQQQQQSKSTTSNEKASSTQKDRTIRELYALKSQLKDMFEERTTLRDRLQCMEQERKLQEVSLGKYKETLQNQKQMNKDLLNEILQLRELQETLNKEKQDKIQSEQKIKMLNIELNELQSEMLLNQQKQNELLSFTSKLTEKNTQLQSENTNLNEKLQQVQDELTQVSRSLKETKDLFKSQLDSSNLKLSEELKKTEQLTEQLNEKIKQSEELTIKLSDEHDENVSLKKKHAANVKDLSRQLQILQKKLNLNPLAAGSNVSSSSSSASATTTSTPISNPNQISPNLNNQYASSSSATNLTGSAPTTKSSYSITSTTTATNTNINHNRNSRTNSISSLNDRDHSGLDSNNSINLLNNNNLTDEDSRSSVEGSSTLASSASLNAISSTSHFNEIICGSDDVYVVDIDKQKIIEKIVKLQKTLAKRNEKIDFLQDHVNQLTLDLKRKTRIIQAYAISEDVGAFTSEAHDAIKREMSRKTGIMSTLYNTNKSYIQTAQFINLNESNMTMDLCLEINRKLQALLEDTLIKNITLKESLETLGHEIARLSQENRQIKLNN